MAKGTIYSKPQVGSSEMFALDKRIARALLLAFNGRIIYDAENDAKPQTQQEMRKRQKPVFYHDQEYSLSALAKILLNVPYAVQGPKFFTFNGDTLSKLRQNGGK